MDEVAKLEFESPDIKGDVLNIILLTYMYVLQCITNALYQDISLILQKREATYADQAEFSLVQYAFAFKLLWAPIVDCVYCKKIGRRKTWLIPTQYLIGFLFLLMSMLTDDLLGSEDGVQKPKIHWLTGIFFFCIFFAATQDTAVDGWSLTMLQRRNIGHSGTSNNVGCTISQILGFVLFFVLESKEFSNKFRSVPQDHGFITFANFLFFWSVVFVISTTLIAVFKKEKKNDTEEEDFECRLGIKESYKVLWKIMKIKPMYQFSLIMLTCNIAFGPLNSVTRLKLFDAGVPQDKFALMTMPSIPLNILLPFVFSRYLTGRRAMRYYVYSYAVKLILTVLYAIFVFFTPNFNNGNGFPSSYYWLLFFIESINRVADFAGVITATAFTCRVSDPRFGGTYMTFFTTVGVVGYRWTFSLALWLVDFLTFKTCNEVGTEKTNCVVVFDGYYTETVICTLLGILWLYGVKKYIYKLEDLPESSWVVKYE